MRAWLWVLGSALAIMTFLNITLYQDISVLRKKIAAVPEECASEPMRPIPKPERKSPRTISSSPVISPPKKDSPPAKEGWDKENFVARKEARQKLLEKVASFVGRSEHETEEAYQARMVPLIKMALYTPRLYIEDLKNYAEEEAQVTDEQDTRIQEIVSGAHQEVIDLLNDATASGALTPYEVNIPGALQVMGDVGDLLQKTEAKMNETLRPEQVASMKAAGFELAEYLAITAPWETLHPPPVKPSDK
jgi:hypothetical protein